MSTAAGPVLVLADHHLVDGVASPRATVLELLALARGLVADQPVEVVWADDGTADLTGALETLGAHGVSRVHRVTGAEDLAPVVGSALAALAARLGSRLVLAPASFTTAEVLARFGVVSGAGVVVDATGLEASGDGVVATKDAFTSTWTTRCAIRTAVAAVSVKPGAAVAQAASTSSTPELLTSDVGALDGVRLPPRVATVVAREVEAEASGPSLAEAQVVVVGGRGTGGDFAPVRELAAALGGAVGATRVATDEGWIGHEAQIGQTGVTVSPRLYIGAGVSGAVHHRGGMQSAGTIVAINDDADSPIFEIADFGIVGDLFAVLPQITAEVRATQGR